VLPSHPTMGSSRSRQSVIDEQTGRRKRPRLAVGSPSYVIGQEGTNRMLHQRGTALTSATEKGNTM